MKICSKCNKGIGLLKVDNGLELINNTIMYIKQGEN